MKNLTVFKNEEFGKIRTVLIDGVVWLVGKDVAKALGYKNHKDALIKHVVEEDKLGSQIATSGQNRKMTLINESGMYSLILSSKLPNAKRFKHWVTSEVLPAIRKTGSYIDPRWEETRRLGKETRKQETSTIKNFIAYSQSQGDNREPSVIYSKLSVLANMAAGMPKRNGRDSATVKQLNICDLCEGIIHNVLLRGMADGKHFAQIEAEAEIRVNDFCRITFSDALMIA